MYLIDRDRFMIAFWWRPDEWVFHWFFCRSCRGRPVVLQRIRWDVRCVPVSPSPFTPRLFLGNFFRSRP
jgi:hypothetical protein